MLDQNLTVLDFVTLFDYLGMMALMGVWFSRRNTNTEQYFVVVGSGCPC